MSGQAQVAPARTIVDRFAPVAARIELTPRWVRLAGLLVVGVALAIGIGLAVTRPDDQGTPVESSVSGAAEPA